MFFEKKELTIAIYCKRLLCLEYPSDIYTFAVEDRIYQRNSIEIAPNIIATVERYFSLRHSQASSDSFKRKQRNGNKYLRMLELNTSRHGYNTYLHICFESSLKKMMLTSTAEPKVNHSAFTGYNNKKREHLKMFLRLKNLCRYDSCYWTLIERHCTFLGFRTHKETKGDVSGHVTVSRILKNSKLIFFLYAFGWRPG